MLELQCAQRFPARPADPDSSVFAELFPAPHLYVAKVCYSNRNVKFENSMHMEWSEEKLLKGIVGDKMRLRF